MSLAGLLESFPNDDTKSWLWIGLAQRHMSCNFGYLVDTFSMRHAHVSTTMRGLHSCAAGAENIFQSDGRACAVLCCRTPHGLWQ